MTAYMGYETLIDLCEHEACTKASSVLHLVITSQILIMPSSIGLPYALFVPTIVPCANSANL